MGKKCINCDNKEIYKNNIALCPVCGNYLKMVKEEILDNYDPYASFYEQRNQQIDYDINEKTERKSIIDSINFEEELGDDDITIEYKDKVNKHQKKNLKFQISKNKINTNKLEVLEGVVRNYLEQEVPTFMVAKIVRCLFYQIPYVHSNVNNTFQIYEDWESSTAVEIMIYGKIARGKILDNNRVKVWARRTKSGTYIATKIYNESTNSYIKINHAINSVTMWFVLIVLIILIYQLFKLNWFDIFISIVIFIVNLLISLVTFLFSIFGPLLIVLLIGWLMIRTVFKK